LQLIHLKYIQFYINYVRAVLLCKVIVTFGYFGDYLKTKYIAMEPENVFKTKMGKVLLTFIIVLGIIGLAKSGYHFGQWLFTKLH